MAVTKGGKARMFANGHPLVFSGALDRIVGRPPPRTGDCIVLADGAEKVIAWGVYNSVSMFRVRCAGWPCLSASPGQCYQEGWFSSAAGLCRDCVAGEATGDTANKRCLRWIVVCRLRQESRLLGAPGT